MSYTKNKEWMQIIDFSNYKISNHGEIININTGKKISVSVHKHGYHVVRLWNSNKSKLCKLYRLLSIHFIPNPENKREVNHKDGNRMNFSLDNLEWTTPSENMKHAYKNGLTGGTFKPKFESKLCKLSKEDILYIREKRKNREMKLNELAIKFNITPDHVSRIGTGKLWKTL